MRKRAVVNLIECANNGGCGECACECHTDVEIPGPHIPTCKFADPDYTPPDFAMRVEFEQARGATGPPVDLRGEDAEAMSGLKRSDALIVAVLFLGSAATGVVIAECVRVVVMAIVRSAQ